MKTVHLLSFLLCLMFFQSLSFAQAPPDSLTGFYIGEYWFRIETNPWTIRTDTIHVISFDEESCLCYYTDWNDSPRYHTVQTSYGYCYGTASNFYTIFHSADSVTEIYDNYTTPPPSPELRSHRFYGKKASIPVSTEEITMKREIRVFPDPVKSILQVEIDESYGHDITYGIRSLEGKTLISGTLRHKGGIDVSELMPGVYIIYFRIGGQIVVKKIIKI